MAPGKEEGEKERGEVSEEGAEEEEEEEAAAAEGAVAPLLGEGCGSLACACIVRLWPVYAAAVNTDPAAIARHTGRALVAAVAELRAAERRGRNMASSGRGGGEKCGREERSGAARSCGGGNRCARVRRDDQ